MTGDARQAHARTGPIPTTADQLTPPWLTVALRPSATPDAGGSVQVVGVRAAPVGVGLGLVGALHRVELTWTGGSGPASVVAKVPAVGEQSRAVATALDMYRNEVHFYRDLAESTDMAITCHHAVVDERTHDFVLLLDDMSARATLDQLVGCPADQADAVVTTLADHHARHWGESGLDRTPWLRRLSDPVLVDPLVAAVRSTWPAIRARYGRELDAEVIALGDRLADLLPGLASDLSRPPCTLAHGDFRLDNMFIDPHGQVRLCDWQLTDRSRGVRDLAYFLTQSLSPAVRATSERTLIALYVARLARHGIDYDADEAWHDYRVATLFGLVYAVVVGGGLDQDDSRSAALTRVMLERSASAIADHCISLG